MIDPAKKSLAAAFIAFWTGCIAYASPVPVNCYTQAAPYTYCEPEFIWVPGYWSRDYYGHREWHPGYYRKRMPIRDHRW